MKNKRAIVISGYYGFHNIGDDAILASIVDEIRRLDGTASITALTNKPKMMKKLYGVDCKSRWNIISVISALRSAGLLISGGGSLFQDATSTRSVLYYGAVCAMAKLFGVKLYIYANGIGPLGGERNRRRVKKILSLADRISVRDIRSYNELIAFGADRRRVALTADPVFLQRQDMRLLHRGQKKSQNGYFAVNLKPCRGIDDIGIAAMTGFVCREIAQKYSLTPHFIPMQSPMDDDMAALCARISGGELMRFENADEVTKHLCGAAFAIGMRLHFLICAALAALPAAALSCDVKVDAFMEYLGISNVLAVDEVSAESLFSAVEAVIADRDKTRSSLVAKTRLMRDRARCDVRRAVELFAG